MRAESTASGVPSVDPPSELMITLLNCGKYLATPAQAALVTFPTVLELLKLGMPMTISARWIDSAALKASPARLICAMFRR